MLTEHLRQDEGVLRAVVLVHGGLLGVQLVMEDGQLAQALHKSISFGGKNCGSQQWRYEN